MTREAVNKYMKIVAGYAREHYGLKALSDLSKESYELINDGNETYAYYPNIPGVLIGSKFVTWETGRDDLCEVDIHDPEHLAEIIRRGKRLQYDNIVGVLNVSRKGEMTIDLVLPEYVKPEYSASVSVDNTVIHYNPNDIDLESNPHHKVIAKALFLAKRYNREYIIPYVDREPEEWGMYE